jgi:hypothetical protein
MQVLTFLSFGGLRFRVQSKTIQKIGLVLLIFLNRDG